MSRFHGPTPTRGHYVTGQIELRTSDALTVPETALVFRDGINYLFKINDFLAFLCLAASMLWMR